MTRLILSMGMFRKVNCTVARTPFEGVDIIKVLP
jgi:hypothetical protein